MTGTTTLRNPTNSKLEPLQKKLSGLLKHNLGNCRQVATIHDIIDCASAGSEKVTTESLSRYL